MRENHADWEALREELDWDGAASDAEDEDEGEEARRTPTPEP